MKKGGIVIPTTMILIATLLLTLLVFVFFIDKGGQTFQTACWNKATEQLKPLTGKLDVESLAIGKLLGDKDKFAFAMEMPSSCVDRVIFGDVDSCRLACRGTDRYDPDVEDCIDECLDCADKKGCIIAVPKTSDFGDVGKEEIKETLKKLDVNIKAFDSKDFGFTPSRTYISPEEGSEILCLNFFKEGDAYFIANNGIVNEADGCKLSESLSDLS